MHLAITLLYYSGNAVLLKPSDLAVHMSNLLMEIVPQYLDKVKYLYHNNITCIQYYQFCCVNFHTIYMEGITP